jgi:hypothetical protein
MYKPNPDDYDNRPFGVHYSQKPLDVQRRKVEKLLQNPDKPVKIPTLKDQLDALTRTASPVQHHVQGKTPYYMCECT